MGSLLDRPAMLVLDHLSRVEADLLEAMEAMAHRLHALVSRLPAGDPDRAILAACIRDLEESTRRQRLALLSARRSGRPSRDGAGGDGGDRLR